MDLQAPKLDQRAGRRYPRGEHEELGTVTQRGEFHFELEAACWGLGLYF